MIYDYFCLAIAIGSVIFTSWHCGVYLGTIAADYYRRCGCVTEEDNATDRTDEQQYREDSALRTIGEPAEKVREDNP